MGKVFGKPTGNKDIFMSVYDDSDEQEQFSPYLQMLNQQRGSEVSGPVLGRESLNELWNEYYANNKQLMDEQKSGIEEQEAQANKLAQANAGVDLTPMLALSDAWTGSNFTGSYKKPMNEAEKSKLMSGLQNEITKRKADLSKENISMLRDLIHARQKTSTGLSAKDLLPGQESADRAFGKEYQDWNAQGGYAGVEKQLNLLEDAKNKLSKDSNLSGGYSTLLPDSLRKRITPESMVVEQQTKEAAQSALRQTLGPQFTEKEGRDVMERAYDPALPVAENIRKIDAAIQNLRSRAIQKDRASKYFERYGTLKGFDASTRPMAQKQSQDQAAIEWARNPNSPNWNKEQADQILKANGVQ
jgi:hypothetical protein